MATADLGLAINERMTIDPVLRAGAQAALADPGAAQVQKGARFHLRQSPRLASAYAPAVSATAPGPENAMSHLRPRRNAEPVTCANAKPQFVYYRLAAAKSYRPMSCPRYFPCSSSGPPCRCRSNEGSARPSSSPPVCAVSQALAAVEFRASSACLWLAGLVFGILELARPSTWQRAVARLDVAAPPVLIGQIARDASDSNTDQAGWGGARELSQRRPEAVTIAVSKETVEAMPSACCRSLSFTFVVPGLTQSHRQPQPVARIPIG